MKMLTNDQLMEKLVEAYKRGMDDARLEFTFEQRRVERRLASIVYADTGGYDGLGVKRG